MKNIELLETNAKEIRRAVLDTCYASSAGHVGGSLSSTDILNVLYNHVMNVDPSNPDNDTRDRFVLSKGHIAESLFCTLSIRGYFPKEDLKSFSQFKSKYIGHPNNKISGIEMNTGALGHGLSVAVGMAIAAKQDEKPYYTYVLMGDGELAEGSIWEAAMAASHYKLDNLVAIIDRNGLQISGATEDVMSLEQLHDKWSAFGFHVISVNGHNYKDLIQVFDEAKAITGKPIVIIADTIKGKGVSFMENNAKWHHGVMDEEQYKQAIKEVEGADNNE
ncbi:transketolase [Breznakia pachnodae]|uniref:Transketolase n=1 Tax=Breznakia pachnodae TaxID=265178 RepID=A0ABU0DZX6_9FIRM|nr:transketolase [Breznakia pachnodae]MDQ0360187.1 transketolase [Breznakia pachnodae]